MMRANSRRPWLAATLSFVALMSLIPQGEAGAQQAASLPLAPGTRVRVTSANLVAPLVANFLQMRGDTAVFIEDASGRGIWSLAMGDITRIERSDGERKANRPYMARGAAVGGVGGLAVGLLIASSVKPSDATKKYSRGLSGGTGAVLGALVGAAVGSRFGSERWTTMSLPKRMSVLSDKHGLALRLGFDF